MDNNFNCMRDVKWRRAVPCSARKIDFSRSMGGGEIFRRKEVTESVELQTVQHYIKDVITATADAFLGIKLGERKKRRIFSQARRVASLRSTCRLFSEGANGYITHKECAMFPYVARSHKVDLTIVNSGNYHTLNQILCWTHDLKRVRSRETTHSSNFGDVLVFFGGSFLHGSPAGPSKSSRERLRLATYGNSRTRRRGSC